ncbi:MAG: hypothetical protein RLZ12_418 [Bacillota bacterium]|jgi:putative ABC transport system ATP-binding protein
MLILQNISITLNKNTKLERPVLQNLSLTVTPGEFVVIIGPNGAGKSTLLNIITGSLKPDSGLVSLAKAKRKKNIAIVTQDPRVGTMEQLTIYENMALALKRGAKRGFKPIYNKKRKELFHRKLALLNMGLEKRITDLVANLSGGERQALSLIMACLTKTKILLLDEITAALDPKTATQIMHLADHIIRTEKLACLMITHNMNHALKYGDRTLLLKNGHFAESFTRATKTNITPATLAAKFED